MQLLAGFRKVLGSSDLGRNNLHLVMWDLSINGITSDVQPSYFFAPYKIYFIRTCEFQRASHGETP